MHRAPSEISILRKHLDELYAELPTVPIELQLEQYSLISDALVKLSMLKDLDGVVQNILKIARTLQTEFSIESLKKVFTSIVIDGYDAYLIMNDSTKNEIMVSESTLLINTFELPIVHLYKKVSLKFHIIFNSSSNSDR